MRIIFSFTFCFKSSFSRVLNSLGEISNIQVGVDMKLAPSYWYYGLERNKISSIDFREQYDAMIQNFFFNVDQAIVISPYSEYTILEIISKPFDISGNQAADVLSESKKWARYIQKKILKYGDFTYQHQMKVVSNKHLLSLNNLLLYGFSETAIVESSSISRDEFRVLEKYCGAEAEEVEFRKNDFQFISGLSSNIIINANNIESQQARWLIMAATLNFSVADFNREWGRYISNFLVSDIDTYNIRINNDIKKILQKSRLSLIDTAKENYLSTGIYGKVYQQIWNTWQGGNIQDQARQRCSEIALILQEKAHLYRANFEQRLTIIAYAITVFSIASLVIDSYSFIKESDIAGKIILFSVFLILMIIFVLTLRRKN